MMGMKIAFDLDETLGVPLIVGSTMTGWVVRPGCLELLAQLRERATLCLWSVSPRRYVDKALAGGLGAYFSENYSWDEMPTGWKDVRAIGADLLVDDSPHHRERAMEAGIGERYVVVPSFGSPEDVRDPLAWARQVEEAAGVNRPARP